MSVEKSNEADAERQNQLPTQTRLVSEQTFLQPVSVVTNTLPLNKGHRKWKRGLQRRPVKLLTQLLSSRPFCPSTRHVHRRLQSASSATAHCPMHVNVRREQVVISTQVRRERNLLGCDLNPLASYSWNRRYVVFVLNFCQLSCISDKVMQNKSKQHTFQSKIVKVITLQFLHNFCEKSVVKIVVM